MPKYPLGTLFTWKTGDNSTIKLGPIGVLTNIREGDNLHTIVWTQENKSLLYFKHEIDSWFDVVI